MAHSARSRPRVVRPPATPRFYLLAMLLLACAGLGGSARADSPGLLVLRPAVVLLLGGLLLLRGPVNWREVRTPLLLLGAFAATMAMQLVPLPPALWARLPGHAPLAPSIALAGDQLGWRPVSLDPDLTLNALVALLPALAVIIGFAALGREDRGRLLGWVVGIAVASAILGLVQLASGAQGAAYLYRFADHGLPIGLMANRNHQAVLLALAIPALWLWARQTGAVPSTLRMAVAGGATLLALPTILMTGSRAGMAATVVALVATPWIAGLRLSRRLRTPRQKLTLAAVAAAALVLGGLAAYTALSGQALAFDRLAGTDVSGERRVQALPVLLRMLGDFLPWGLGQGAFEPVFRLYEPDAMLMPSYFNRAHSDPLEVAMSGGVPAILVMVGLLVWLAIRGFAVLRAQGRTASSAGLARLGAFSAFIWLAASIADYPLRTPLGSVLFVLACLWMTEGGGAPGGRDAPDPRMSQS